MKKITLLFTSIVCMFLLLFNEVVHASAGYGAGAGGLSVWSSRSYAPHLVIPSYYEFNQLVAATSSTEEFDVAGTCLVLGTTSYGPMYSTTSATAVNRTAVIYPANQLVGVAGQDLAGIHFNRTTTGNSPSGAPHFKLYLKETPNIDFGVNPWTWDTTGATLVYDSNPTADITSGVGWKNFPFSTKFLYSGTQNLMVLMEYMNGGNTTSISWEYEYSAPCIDTSNNNTTKYNNNTTGALEPILASSNYRRPHIKFDFAVSCGSVKDITASAITSTSATISWTKGGAETAWEYAVQPVGQGLPTTFTTTTTPNVALSGLSPTTNYEVYVRADCGVTDGKSTWKMEGFGTACGTIVSSLWWEGFNSDSAGLRCWKIVDGNGDSTSPTGNNIWKTSTVKYEGTHSMYFYGNQSDTTKQPHDDWLISPSIKMQASKQYRLKYHYRTTSSSTALYSYQFEVLMSSTGSDTSKFTHTIIPKKDYTPKTAWEEAYVIINGVDADVNLAWHVTSPTQYTYLYIDNIFIEEVVGCPEPMDIGVKEVKDDKATLFWSDVFGATSWEYYVQEAGGNKPTTTTVGTTTTTKEVTVSVDVTSTGLKANTEYEYYVRTKCIGGGESIWQGPFVFRTLCKPIIVDSITQQGLWEGFNTDSQTIDCWTIVDNNGDATTATSGLWHPNKGTGTAAPKEGDQSMRFYASSNPQHDDWLISPTIKVDSTQIVRVRYSYKTTTSYSNNFEVRVAVNGADLSNFSTVLTTKTGESSTVWQEEDLFISGVSGEINIAWVVNTKSSASYVYIDDVYIQEVSCSDATDLTVKNLKSDEVTLAWEDAINTSWEYYVQDVDAGTPSDTDKGTPTTTKEVNVKRTQGGSALKDDTEYEYYVRAKCANGKFSGWAGPIIFKTTCKVISNFPFTESFETGSSTLGCWTSLDVNNDGTTSNNQWLLYNSKANANGGDYSMRFYGTSTPAKHDDYLISPAIKMDSTSIYELSYFFKTTSTTSYNSEFEVVISTDGLDVNNFTHIVEPKTVYRLGAYEKRTVYITGVHGDAHIAWHVISSGYSYAYIDDVSVREVGCIGPEDEITIKDIQKNEATFSWKDGNNQKWEYYVQVPGAGIPTGRGTEVTTTEANPKRTGGPAPTNLLPNTEYEFYVRSICGPNDNKKYSGYIGPVTFRTLCDVQVVFPFEEGFDDKSETRYCWTVIDANGDSTSATSNIWDRNTTKYEGTHSMRFYGSQSDEKKRPHNDWLISPMLRFDATKIYQLKYYYRTSSSSTATYDYEFAVLLSDTGGDNVSKFTEPVVPKKKYNASNDWVEKIAYISGIGGDVNLAWHVTSENAYTYVYIDNISIIDISCPQPLDLDVKDIGETEATLFWSDKFGAEWQYYVTRAGGVAPTPTTTGTVTKNKEQKVTQDSNGNTLVHTTEYDYYVRTVCNEITGDYSEWSGPYTFRTACGAFDTPFSEGFDAGSVTLQCWTVADGNGDATSSSNVWGTSTTRYEGTHAAYFYGNQNDAAKRPHNDWLISPRIKFEVGKKYRLKYRYRTTSTTSYDYEFAVLMSTTGSTTTTNYNQVIVPKKKYDPSIEWKEEYVFIDGVDADISLAWQVTSSTQYTYLYIDKVSVEEVTGCPEPLPSTLGTKDEDSKKVTLFWDDAFGATAWEYYIQEEGGDTPKGKGIATATKESIATLDGKGQALTPNTDYEFYVRTNCGDGTFSIWQGPFKFSTICGVYDIPFVEGFNTLEKSYRCWTVIDVAKDATSPTGSNIWRIYNIAGGVFEGDQAMYFQGVGNKTHDDWLISPTIKMEAANYTLKYYYRSTTSNNNEFEVLLSSQGIDTASFTKVVLPSKVYKNGTYEEEVTFFNGVAGDINLAWHVKSIGATTIYLDKITLKKVDTCPEPYHVKATAQTASTIDLEWKQDGGVTAWEILLVDYGEDETATPVLTTTVTGTPKTTLTGVPGGKAFTIFVRAKCADGTSHSDWSTSIDWGSSVGGSNVCSGALTIPVNSGFECEKTISGSFIGLVDEGVILPPDCRKTNLVKDVWFEFTAMYDRHMLRISDWKDLSGKYLSPVNGAIYDQACGSITNTPLECFTLTNTVDEIGRSILFNDLVPGQKYYIRLGVPTTSDADQIFRLCITSIDYLRVSKHGDVYTAEELIKDVLVKSNCDLVSNVRYQVGDGSVATNSINTLGYFERGRSDFPFEKGIVLSTSEVEFVPGPFTTGNKGNNPHRWNGDRDINNAINDAGGGPRADKRVTQIEFDFTPIKDSIHFEYLFSSNSYIQGCTYTCANGALFAAWLIDTATGEGINLAKIKGTNTAISLYTIWDNTKITGTNCLANPELFWRNYSSGSDGDPRVAPINFAGSTIGMTSEKVHVVPGRKYHIKLAVMDFCPTQSHSSAVFFNAGSFDLGDLNLGADLLVEDGNALCGGECVTINSGLGNEENVIIEWYKDGVLIPEAKGPDYEACESGVYKVVGKFPEINCEVTGERIIEIFPPISKVVRKPEVIQVCTNSLVPIVLDLDSQEDEMFVNVDRDDYETTYYLELADAEQGSDNFIDPEFAFDPKDGGRSVYIRIVDERTQCSEAFEMVIAIANGETPSKPEDVVVCSSYTLPSLKENQYYYTGPATSGIEYKAGEVLDVSGEHIIYILQLNGDEGCYEETHYTVSITGDVVADIFPDATRDCTLFILEPLSEGSKYFTESGGPEGKGFELMAGTIVRPIPGSGSDDSRTIYVYTSSEDGLCVDESSFTVKFEDCPIQKGLSPNGDGLNDSFDLSPHGVMDLKIYNRYGSEVYSHGVGYTNEWMGQDKNGKGLPDGTYYYVVISNGKVRTGWVQINR